VNLVKFSITTRLVAWEAPSQAVPGGKFVSAARAAVLTAVIVA
jgi:hypothetical protein